MNGIEEVFKVMPMSRLVPEIKRRAINRGYSWRGVEIIIFNRPMPGWVRVKQEGYEQFITVREENWIF